MRNVEMAEKISIELNIRIYEHTDMEDIIHIWEECGLIRSWNNPKLDIWRKTNTTADDTKRPRTNRLHTDSSATSVTKSTKPISYYS